MTIYQPRITIIGGGTGTSTLFPALSRLTSRATALVAMSDSGGSSGRLMQEFGALGPLGDLSNVITAASDNAAVRAMQGLRFPGEGPLAGHSARNMALAGFVLEHGLARGVALFCKAMQTRGKVLPITLEQNSLVMKDGPGVLVKGQHLIDRHAIRHPAANVWLEPAACLNPSAKQAIATADLVVLAPGSPYTSLLAALHVAGAREALAATRAPKILVANLVNDPLHTLGWHVVDYVHLLKRNGVSPDAVLYNTAPPTAEMRASYEAEGKQVVDTRLERFVEIPRVEFIGANVLSSKLARRNPYDRIQRGLMRHNPLAVAAQLQRFLSKVQKLTLGKE